jgi:type I restriction enzyme S subunit
MGQTILKEDLQDTGSWPVFSATEGDLYFGRVDNPRVRLKAGDLIIPARGNSIGAVKMVQEPATTTQTTIYCQNLFGQVVSARFAYYFMVGCRKYLFPMTQTAIPQITVDEVSSNPFFVPPILDQENIVQFLDLHTTRSDDIIARYEKLIKLLEEKRLALISQVVTSSESEGVPKRDSGIEWIGEIPEHWDVIPLKYLVAIFSGATPDKSNVELWSGKIPWASAKDLKVETLFDTEDHISDEAVNQSGLRIFPPGCILTVVRGMILAHTLPVVVNGVPLTINQDLKVLQPKEMLRASYLAQFLRSRASAILARTDNSAHGTKVLRSQDWTRFCIPVPPLSEQDNIVESIETKTASVRALIAASTRAISLVKERRLSLITAVVTGKIQLNAGDYTHATVSA